MFRVAVSHEIAAGLLCKNIKKNSIKCNKNGVRCAMMILVVLVCVVSC